MPDQTTPGSTTKSEPVSTERLAGDLQTAGGELSHAAEDLAGGVAAGASKLRDAATDQLSQTAEAAKGYAEQQKSAAADGLGGVSQAVQRAAEELGNAPETAAIAGYARDLAGGLNRASETMRSSSVDELIEMGQDFGRRQPLAFLGAAALAGFAASRFIMASARRRQTPAQPATSTPSTPTSTTYSEEPGNGY